jgi:alpha-mannosidase
VRLDGDHVAVTAVKKAERGEALVVRLCEVSGGRRRVRLHPVLTATGASRCDLLERPRARLDLQADGGVDVELGAFQVATLRFESA